VRLSTQHTHLAAQGAIIDHLRQQGSAEGALQETLAAEVTRMTDALRDALRDTLRDTLRTELVAASSLHRAEIQALRREISAPHPTPDDSPRDPHPTPEGSPVAPRPATPDNSPTSTESKSSGTQSIHTSDTYK
jgi:hypothetical protein